MASAPFSVSVVMIARPFDFPALCAPIGDAIPVPAAANPMAMTLLRSMRFLPLVTMNFLATDSLAGRSYHICTHVCLRSEERGLGKECVMTCRYRGVPYP